MGRFEKIGSIFILAVLIVCFLSSLSFGSVDYRFDDFEGPAAPCVVRNTMNDFYGEKGPWSSGATLDDSIDCTVYHGTKGCSLKLVYDLSKTTDYEVGYYERFTYYYPDPPNPIYNMSEFDEFRFFIKGGSSYTTTCRIEFLDINWNEVSVPITGITDSWQEISVKNLQSYSAVDWTQMRQWTIVLRENEVDAPSGVLFIDDLTFIDNDVTIQNDMDFINLWQERMFKFFWDCANPDNGLIRDRTSNLNECSIASVGFGLTAICIGIERGWITYSEGYNRVLTTLNSFHDDPIDPNDFYVESKDGLFYHFVDINTGQWNGKDGVSTIDTALLMAGILTCRKYFSGTAVENLADDIYRAVQWDTFISADETLHMLWTPTPSGGYSVDCWRGYNEAMILYLMAIGSPTHPVSVASWEAWASKYVDDWGAYYGYGLLTCPPLFTHQYSHCWIDFREKKDGYTNYFQNSTYATKVNRIYGRDIWYPNEDMGNMSATDSCTSYHAFGFPPAEPFNDGTIDPHSTVASIVFTPGPSISSTRYIYDHYKSEMWGIYGLTSGINTYLDPNWFDDDYIGINLGNAIIMIENFNSYFVWDIFMGNAEINSAMAAVGFIDDFTKETAYYREAEEYNNATGGGSIRIEDHNEAWRRKTVHCGSDSDNPSDGIGDEFVYNFTIDWGGDNVKFKIRYSDDVAGNNIEVYLDNVLKGTFVTDNTGGWNDFEWDSEIIDLGPVSSGAHTIKLRVATGGSYGVNLDVFKIYRNYYDYYVAPQPLGNNANAGISRKYPFETLDYAFEQAEGAGSNPVTVYVTSDMFSEDLIKDGAKELVFSGGWNSIFTGVTGLTSIGPMILENGGLTVENMCIQ